MVADVRHKGLLAGIELARNSESIVMLKNKERVNYFIIKESLKLGVHLRPLGNIMMVIPPLAIGREDLGKLLDVQLEILKKVEKLS